MARARIGTAALLAGLWLLASAPPAGAHALLKSSDPRDGSKLESAPTLVTATFTEEPELSLSRIQVLDQTGSSFEAGLEHDANEPLMLRVPVGDLGEGVYTVAWKVVSKVDGHATGGAFTFGVGVDPGSVPPLDVGDLGSENPPPSPLEVVARWALFVGLGLVIGAAWLGAVGFSELPGGVRRLVTLGTMTSAIGLLLLAEAQRIAADAGYGQLFGTSLGRALIARAVGVGIAALAAFGTYHTSGRARRAIVVVGGIGAAAAMYAHVASGHAGVGDGWPRKVTAQWVHFVAVGVWLGGLAALLAGVRGEPGEAKARAVKRFSTVAAFALAAVAGTGILRALNEIPSWGDLFTSLYGALVLTKIALLGVLAGLGAINRYRNVPEARASLAGLRRISRAELVTAVAVLVAAALLASLTPPRSIASAASVAGPIQLAGSDFATTVRLELDIEPGFTGANDFQARVSDYDTGEPIEAVVRLTFTFLDDSSVGESRLVLEPAGGGVYEAAGGNLSLDGRWQITALIQQETDSAEIRLQTATRCRARAFPIDGGPTLYDIEYGSGRVAQGYVDPGTEGFNEVHITFFDAEGKEMQIPSEAGVGATERSGGRVEDLVVRRFSPGHFVGDAQLEPGTWRFDVRARTEDDERIRLCFEEVIQE